MIVRASGPDGKPAEYEITLAAVGKPWGGEGGEIEVTPEMVEAGLAVSLLEIRLNREEVEEIYRAMEAARRKG